MTDRINILRKESLFLKFVWLAGWLILMDVSIGSLLRYFYFRQQAGEIHRTVHAFNKTEAKLLVFGSSTAIHNFHPDAFNPYVNGSFYNTGRDGCTIFYQYALLKAILKRYTPKTIILNFDQAEFVDEPETYDYLSSLLPFYRDHPEIRDILKLKSPYEKVKLVSQIYPFNSYIFSIAIGSSKKNKMRRADYQGYVPLDGSLSGPLQDGNTIVNFAIDPVKVQYYKYFIEACKLAGVKLIVVCSPFHVKPNYELYNMQLGKKITEGYGLSFNNYSKDSMFLKHPEYFDDISHLNDKGALIFSRIVARLAFEDQQSKP